MAMRPHHVLPLTMWHGAAQNLVAKKSPSDAKGMSSLHVDTIDDAFFNILEVRLHKYVDALYGFPHQWAPPKRKVDK